MAITITSRKIKDKLRPATDVTWSLFAIGEPITIEIEFEVFTLKTFTTNSKLSYSDPATQDNYALSNNGGKLSGFNVGDTIKVEDSALSLSQTATVLAVISSNLIITDVDWGSVIGAATLSDTAIIYNITQITGVAMPYNFIENNENINYLSKVDGTYQKLWADNVDAANTTPVAMNFDGSVCYQIGSATIEGVSYDTSNGKQKFKIIHETVVTPYFIATQINDLTNNIAPGYFAQNKCWRHVYQIDAYAIYSNPNSKQTVQSPIDIGNSGWFNEVFNGGIADYAIKNIAFKDYLGNGLTELETTLNEQTIEFDIYSTAGHWTTTTEFELGFGKLPNNTTEYQNNNKTFEQNFLFTNTLNDTTGTPVAPTTASTSYQTIKEFSASITNVNTIHVVVTIQFGSDAIAVINQSLTPKYLFWVTISNPSITTAAAQNKQAISGGVQTIKSFQFSDVVVIMPKFIRHYEQVTDDGVIAGVTTFKEDECVMYCSLFLTPFSYPLPTKYTTLKSQLIAKKNDGSEFILEDFTIYPPNTFSGVNQLTNFSTQRVFQIPLTEPRKIFEISDCYADGDKIRLDITHGFMIRWEYWVQLIGASTDFYDANEPQNGLNNNWFRYQNTDWKVYHRVSATVDYDGTPMTYTTDTEIEINDYESNTDFTTKDVETYRMNGTSLFDSVNSRWYILPNANTQVKATFVKNIPININLSYVVFGIEIFEQGGIGGRQRYSSKWNTSTPLTCFIPLTGVSGNKVELSQPSSDTIIAKAVIDYTLLPQGNVTYKIVARLYENNGSAGNKITEDGIDKFTEDDIQKIIE